MKKIVRIFLFATLVVSAVKSVYCQYNVTSWTADEGLPQNAVYSILQTKDGYLWFTTLDGLVRFDGVSFNSFSKSNTPGLNSNRFNSLLQDINGDLWIGTDDGGLTRYHEGRFTTYTTQEGLPHNAIRRLLSDGQGGLIIVTWGGVVQWQRDRFIPVVFPAAQPDPSVTTGYRDRSGALWYTTAEGVHKLDQAGLTSYSTTDYFRGYSVTSIFEDSRHNLWLGTVKLGLARLKDGQFTIFNTKDGLPDPYVTSIYEDRMQNLWVGTRRGLASFKEGRFTNYTTAQGISGDYVQSIYEDREGNLWVGTDNRGLNRLTRRAITFYTTGDGLLAEIIYPIVQDSLGAIWIGGRDGSLTRYQDGVFAPAIPAGPGPFSSTTALAADRRGRLWIGKIGSLSFLENGRLQRLDLGVSLGIVRAIHEDRDGGLWVATNTSLFRYEDKVVTAYTNRDGLAGDDVQALLEDHQGRLWIGTYGGLSYFENGTFKSFTEKDGLPSNRIRSLYEDAEGVLWIGTYDGGLGRYQNGRFTRYTIKEGLFNNGVFTILEDRKGNLWMSCNRGIYRASRQQLNDFAAGKITEISSIAYGKQDGLLNIECNGGRQPAGYKMRDGKLWFPTQGGVAVVDPEAISINQFPPAVVIENCMLQREDVDCRQPIEVKPGKDNLEIHYTGLSFNKPELVRFKYKLEGLDVDWVNAGNRRVAYYPHLPPGRYAFRVIAANSDGVWNQEGAVLSIVVFPPFWRTWWFISLITLGIAGIAFTLYQYRVRQLRIAHASQEAFSRQLIESQELERKRIAAELHDSLGQNLLIIKNRALLGTTTSEQAPAAKEQFATINATASQAIDEVRQIAYNLRPYHLDRLGVTSAIEDMLEKVAASTGIKFKADIAPIDGLFSKPDEINIYRIMQECVNNIVKHSKATEARVSLERNGPELLITVEDNGQGFTLNEQDSRKRGFGLTGIAERTKMLGGAHKIQSAGGQGTRVIIKINLPDRGLPV